MILVLGANGATGRLVVKYLLDEGQTVCALVRSANNLPEELWNQRNLSLLTGSILEIPERELKGYLKGCDAVISCLGHNLTLKGIYGDPRWLVTGAVRQICDTVFKLSPTQPVRFILMNTTGNRNPDLNETYSLSEQLVISLIRILVPPHSDNEQAAKYLLNEIGKDHPLIEWVVVRPDSLIDEELVSHYEVFRSPARSPVFNSGKTSRTNVAHFMATLVTDRTLWRKWQGQMPVIYNQ